jgi:hypothetical protein
MTTPWSDYGRGGTDPREEELRRQRRAKILGAARGTQIIEEPVLDLPAVNPQPRPLEELNNQAPPPLTAAQPRIEPSLYGDYIRNQSPVQGSGPDGQLSPEQLLRRNVDDTQDPRSFSKKQGVWNRLGKGILAGLRDWSAAGAPGGPLGALGAIATGGTLFAASNKIANEDDRRSELGRLFNQYQPYAALNKQEAELAKGRIDTQKGLLDIEGKSLDNVLKKFGVSIDQAKAMDEMPAELAQALRSAGIMAFGADWGEYEPSINSQGLPVVRRKKGSSGYRVDPTGTPDPSKAVVPITVTGPDGKTVTGYQESGKAVTTAATIAENAYDNAWKQEERHIRSKEKAEDRAFDIQKFNTEQANKWSLEYSKGQVEIAKQAATVLGLVPGFQGQYEIYNEAIADINKAHETIAAKPAESPEYKNALIDLDKARERADKALSEGTKIAGQGTQGANIIEQLRQALPPKPKTLADVTPEAKPARKGKARFSDADIRRVIRQ